MNSVLRTACVLLFIGRSPAAHAQLSDAAKSAVLIEFKYSVSPNLTYGTASNQELKLDVYRPEGAKVPTPVVMYIHGGGGVRGDKNKEVLSLLSYLEMGWAAVNVEYRLARVAPAPAAVTDCRCALRWIGRNAKEYNFDVSKIVVTGGSTGGQLALLTAMVPATAGLENDCLYLDDKTWFGPVPETPKVAAVINWVGVTDMSDLLKGTNTRSWALSWLGTQPSSSEEIARRTSPINYARPGLPPILTIHGNADPIVPYSQAVRLHAALTKAGVRNQLVTVESATHGDFTIEQTLHAYSAIREFLAKSNLALDK
jgi:acetyl esterase/lipase